jgi:lipid A 3-O-deacylase
MRMLRRSWFLVAILSAGVSQAQVAAPQNQRVGHVQDLSSNRVEGSSLSASLGQSEAGVTQSPVREVANSTPWEYGAVVQGGVGLEQRTDFSFFLAGGHLGKVITPELGAGLFKGNFEYAVEVFPLWQSYTPKFQRLNCPIDATTSSQCYGPTTTGGTYRGVSITPIMLRWNFTHGRRFMPWAQAAGGLVYTTRKYPGVGDLDPTDATQTGPAADTSVWNFTPQGGIGAHYFVRPRRSVDMSVNAVHISSSSLGDKNPGVNVSLQISIGYTWWK